MNARENILNAIRAARPLQDPPDFVRDYRQTLALDQAGLTERLTKRLIDYGVTVSHVVDAGGLPALAEARMAARGLSRILVPPGLPQEWRPPGATEDNRLSPAELNEAEAAMTGCLLAIAESGTIVLDGGALSGRRALTLLPDTHICVVQTDRIVGVLPEAMAALSLAVLSGPLTFFSGPSATADIELERVQGVHGPRTLEVILVGP